MESAQPSVRAERVVMSDTAAAEQSAAPGHSTAGEARERPLPWLLWALVVALLLSVVLGLLAGRADTFSDAAPGLLLSLRAKRVVVGFFCGAGLATAGAVVQGLFRNPLASPHILGIEAGAMLGAHIALRTVVVILGGAGISGLAPELMVPIGAVVGALLSLLVLLSIVSLRSTPLSLLLTGYALMLLFTSAGTLLTHLFQESWELNRAISALQAGSISAAGTRQMWLVMVMVVGGALPVMLWSSTLDVLLCGEEEAQSLGVDVRRARFWLVLWVSVMTAGAVAVGGGVAFVGLIVPHALRPFTGHAHRYLLPLCFLAGGTFLVLCDALSRSLPFRGEVPLSVLTDMIGAPVFLRMLIRLSRKELGRDE